MRPHSLPCLDKILLYFQNKSAFFVKSLIPQMNFTPENFRRLAFFTENDDYISVVENKVMPSNFVNL